MEFNDVIKQFSERILSLKDTITTEESTKMSLVVPLFQLLGYDVFNPNEFCPEYIADVGIKKGEKVDYAILENGQPNILVECKSCSEQLDKHSSQLFRYFGTSPAKFGILTNGIIYRFYTDLEESNKMDLVPFLEIDMENLKDSSINELKKFCKDNFDKDKIFSTAEELKYSSQSYFGILYKDNNRKPICRLNLDARNKQLLIPDANKKFERIYIDSLNDLYKYKNRLIEVVKRYM